MHSYKVLLSQLVKALCLSEIVTQAPFPSTESQGLPSSCSILACDVWNTGNLSDIVTEAPLSCCNLQHSPPSVLFLLVIFRTPGNLSKPGLRLLSSLVRRVSFCFQPSVLSSLLDCNGEGLAFISPLVAPSCYLIIAYRKNIEL